MLELYRYYHIRIIRRRFLIFLTTIGYAHTLFQLSIPSWCSADRNTKFGTYATIPNMFKVYSSRDSIYIWNYTCQGDSRIHRIVCRRISSCEIMRSRINSWWYARGVSRIGVAFPSRAKLWIMCDVVKYLELSWLTIHWIFDGTSSYGLTPATVTGGHPFMLFPTI